MSTNLFILHYKKGLPIVFLIIRIIINRILIVIKRDDVNDSLLWQQRCSRISKYRVQASIPPDQTSRRKFATQVTSASVLVISYSMLHPFNNRRGNYGPALKRLSPRAMKSWSISHMAWIVHKKKNGIQLIVIIGLNVTIKLRSLISWKHWKWGIK